MARPLPAPRSCAPRWKRCVNLVDSQLGRSAGPEVRRTDFRRGREAAHAEDGERRSRRRWRRTSGNLDWMTPETKKQALEKLHAVANKIGYPDKWRDYSARSRSFAATRWAMRTRQRVRVRTAQLGKIGKPVDRAEWEMTPPTVNAYYDPHERHQFPGRHPAAAVLRQQDGRRRELRRDRRGDRT